MTSPTTREIAPSEIRGLVDVESDADRLRTLRRNWRVAALRQWFFSPRLFALLAAMAVVPVLLYPGESAFGIPGPLRGLGNMVQPLAMLLLAPAVTVIFTLLALDGPRGIARFDDLRTIEGGPAEWTRALLLSARVCVCAVITVWAPFFAPASSAEEMLATTFEALLHSQLFLWTIPWIVAACRLGVSIPVVGSVVLWGLSMWPGWMLFEHQAEELRYRCGDPATALALVFFGYIVQGIIAGRQVHSALLSAGRTPE